MTDLRLRTTGALIATLGLLWAGCGDDRPASAPPAPPKPTLAQKLERACGESYIYDLEISDNPLYDKYIIVCADQRVVFVKDND